MPEPLARSWICYGTDRDARAVGVHDPDCPSDVDVELVVFVVEWLWSWACKNFTSDPHRACWSVDRTGTIHLNEGE